MWNYTKDVMDHFLNPRNVREIPDEGQDPSVDQQRAAGFKRDSCLSPESDARERGEKQGRGVLRSAGGKADYASVGMGFSPENTVTVWKPAPA